jgi:hypothetical protein
LLSFFKSNNPAVVIFYILYLLLFRLCFIFATDNAAVVGLHSEPLSNWLFTYFAGFGANWKIVSISLSALLCFIQALLVNNIVNENKILARKNYVAGALYIVFASFFKESLFLSPAAIATTLVILCISRLFSLVKKEKSYGDVFDTGFLIAIATLFYFPCALFIIFVYIGLATVRPFNYREWTIVLLGFAAPLFLVFNWYFWHDTTAQMLKEIANVQPGGWLVLGTFSIPDKLMLGSLGVCTAICLVLLPGSLYSSLIQVRKFANILVVLIVVTLVAGLLQQTVHLSHLIFLALPLGIISAMVFVQIKRSWISEVIHLILILLVLAGQFLPG